MPSSAFDEKAAAPLKSRARAKVDLIAWDPESPEHIERMFQQRIACGWKSDLVQKWRGLQREGKMAIQWVILSEEDPDKEIKLAQHLLKYPNESTPIHDTAITLGAKSREPTSRSFIPVGHISLDSESSNPDQADASQGMYCITTFYISRAIQSGGLGSAAMDRIESEAVNEPLNAKILSLDTLANSSLENEAIWPKMGMDVPTFSNQDWYERRGYKPWKFVDGHIKQEVNGKIWPLDAVFMKKTVI
ncbi:hypothetical protein DL95DRAFT_393397 [Leptodontidium sp. 2 PMI_412]|nr:hypothetical protein BKA61DRAFT_624501 [Leptodontidium sp. MPI-SDFR-AT-0119]KAH9210487.1 hypothetical protein DL95DRAFT_393397 [Leptodontidium sp. 2 PMI_412]